jgi:hypothetical protein
MQVIFVRLDHDGRYTTRIQPDGGVRCSIKHVGHNFTDRQLSIGE